MLLAGNRSQALRRFGRLDAMLAIATSSTTVLTSWDSFPEVVPKRNYSVAREARFLKKLVTGKKQTRRQWYGGDSSSSAMKDMSAMMMAQAQPTSVYGGEKAPKAKSGRVLRRVGVLSSVFMGHISDLLATGDFSMDIAGLGLEITETKISSDFTHIMVYWYSSNPEKEDQLEATLQSSASHIRHVLSQLRVIGQVPPIVFVKDTKYTRIMEVENILATLDFGPDYVPSPLRVNEKLALSAQKFKTGRSTGISQDLDDRLHNLENTILSDNESQDSDSEEVDDSESEAKVTQCSSSPTVRQDMLGLNWGRIMGEIKIEVAKTTRRHQDSRTRVLSSSVTDNDTTADQVLKATSVVEAITAAGNRQKEFLEYLKQRRIQQRKLEKLSSTETQERAFLEEEKLLRRMDLGRIDYIDQVEEKEDYLEDDPDFGQELRDMTK